MSAHDSRSVITGTLERKASRRDFIKTSALSKDGWPLPAPIRCDTLNVVTAMVVR